MPARASQQFFKIRVRVAPRLTVPQPWMYEMPLQRQGCISDNRGFKPRLVATKFSLTLVVDQRAAGRISCGAMRGEHLGHHHPDGIGLPITPTPFARKREFRCKHCILIACFAQRLLLSGQQRMRRGLQSLIYSVEQRLELAVCQDQHSSVSDFVWKRRQTLSVKILLTAKPFPKPGSRQPGG